MSIRDLLMKKSAPEPRVINEFIRNVGGVKFKNEDGSSRQAYIQKLKVGEDLVFKPAPTKEYPDTIGVFTSKGKQIGFVSFPLLKELREKYPQNRASVSVESVTQSAEHGYSCGMKIIIYE